MNQAIRSSWVVAMAMFALILGSLTYVQFFEAEDLNQNDWNSRGLYQQFGGNRGAILVDGRPIAESVPSDGEFEYQRVYNQPELYSALTGFYSLVYGSTKLEAALNDHLAGTSGELFYDRIVQLLSGTQGQGASVELTIDPQLQQLAYDLIPDGQSGSIVAMDPETGDILAMVSKPSYDTNLLAGHNTAAVVQNMEDLQQVPGLSPYANPATDKLLAPGSVFKIIDTVAALESGQYTADSELPNPAVLPLPGTTIGLPNFARGGCAARTTADFSFALEQSCNTPFASIALDLGQEAIAETAQNFGFGEGLNIPIPVTPSQFPEDMDPAQLAQASIGQFDVKATPLQIAMMTAAIANDGELMKPNLIKAVRAPDLQIIEDPQPETFRTSTTPQIANQVTEWMVNVVDQGIAGAAAVPGYSVAGKTGTAELGDSGLNNSWFTGFAPADDPEVVVSVVVEGVDVPTGLQLTTPSAQRILEAVLNK
jgi:penicillin-binding protein A